MSQEISLDNLPFVMKASFLTISFITTIIITIILTWIVITEKSILKYFGYSAIVVGSTILGGLSGQVTYHLTNYLYDFKKNYNCYRFVTGSIIVNTIFGSFIGMLVSTLIIAAVTLQSPARELGFFAQRT